MNRYWGLNRMALPPPTATIVRRAKIVLMALALVAAMLLIAVGSWPLKILVVLAFVRGLFASDVIAFRRAPPAPNDEPAAA
jgi:hypothetical protein